MEMIKITSWDEYDELTADMAEDIGEPIEIQNESIGDDRIYLDTPIYQLADTGFAFAEGVYCNYDEDEDDYMPDFGLTLFWKLKDGQIQDYNQYEYWEQDPPATAWHNYTYATSINEAL